MLPDPISAMSTPTPPSTSKTIYVTRTGLPLTFKFNWPFRHATSGADFEVLHAEITLENSQSLRALVAVNLSATLREVLPSLDAKDTEAPVINALRRDVDNKQIEFLKSVDRTPFFGIARMLTLVGMFALPKYGGNYGGAGWQLIGFEDQHVYAPPFGYYDQEDHAEG